MSSTIQTSKAGEPSPATVPTATEGASKPKSLKHFKIPAPTLLVREEVIAKLRKIGCDEEDIEDITDLKMKKNAKEVKAHAIKTVEATSASPPRSQHLITPDSQHP